MTSLDSGASVPARGRRRCTEPHGATAVVPVTHTHSCDSVPCKVKLRRHTQSGDIVVRSRSKLYKLLRHQVHNAETRRRFNIAQMCTTNLYCFCFKYRTRNAGASKVNGVLTSPLAIVRQTCCCATRDTFCVMKVHESTETYVACHLLEAQNR